MTLNEAMAAHGPAWLGIWLNIMLLGAFILPLTLFIWKPTRLTALFCVVASGLGAVSIGFMYEQLGYVKLLGLPHVLFWTPLAIYLRRKAKDPAVSQAPRLIIYAVFATIMISLAFDYTDVIRYALGERTPLATSASEA